MDNKELFNLCMYLAASAEGLKDEPKDYAPLRLLEVLSRLAESAAAEYNDQFLQRIVAEINDHQNLVMTDKPAFYRFIERLVVEFAQEAKRRVQMEKEV